MKKRKYLVKIYGEQETLVAEFNLFPKFEKSSCARLAHIY